MHRPLSLLLLALALAPAEHSPLTVSGGWLIDFYKTVLSPLQGSRMCNFWPTCSQFTRMAIHGYGLPLGMVIGADRLMRCHALAWSYSDKYYFGLSHHRLRDPVANHLAWTDPEPQPGHHTLVTLEPEQLHDLTAPGIPTPQLAFADHLYEQEEYQRAATEYLRVHFSSSSAPDRTYAALMAGESLLRATDYEGARRIFGELAAPENPGQAQYGIARCWFAEGRYQESGVYLDSILDAELHRQRSLLRGWTLLKQYRFTDAAAVFRGMSLEPELAELAHLDQTRPPRRSRFVGSLLAACLPGAGHLYAGRAGDGVYALLTVAGTGFLTYWFAANPEKDQTRLKVSLCGAIAALFYAANIYGANVAARDYNRLQERQYLARIERPLHQTEALEPDYRAVLDPVSAPTPERH